MDILTRINELNPTIKIREAVPSDIPQITELFNKTYTRKKTETYFHWQFFNCPHPTKMFLTMDNNILAACLGVSVVQLNNNQRCGFTIDLIVDHPYSKKGLFNLLENSACNFALENSATIMTSLPNIHGTRAHIACGWKNLGNITPWISGKIPQINPQINLQINPQISFIKDHAWRFFNNPNTKYYKHIINDNNYCILKHYAPEKITDIVDYQYSDLNNLAKMFLDIQQYNKVETWAHKDSEVALVLEKLGYKIAEKPIRNFCIKNLNKNLQNKDLYILEKWQLVPGDSEVY